MLKEMKCQECFEGRPKIGVRETGRHVSHALGYSPAASRGPPVDRLKGGPLGTTG